MASYSFLDNNGLLYFWQKIKNTFAKTTDLPTKTSELTNDSGFITTSDIPEGAAASTTVPLMDGTAATGTELAFARGDHRHPSDTAKLDKAGGTMTGALTLHGAPTANLHAATKKYVDDNIPTKVSDLTNDEGYTTNVGTITGISMNGASKGTSGVVDLGTVITAHQDISGKLDKSGGTMTGLLTLSGAPTSNLHAATKKYVDDQASSKADIASPDFTGTPTVPTATAGTNNTQIASTAFVTTAVANAIAGVTGIEYQIVVSLPATGEAGVIYLISNSGSNPNSYDEYIYVNDAFEKIGTTDVDLSGYVEDSDMVAITNAQIDTIVAS